MTMDELNNSIIKIFIENLKSIPNNLTSVPTLILDFSSQSPKVLVGKAAFKWLEEMKDCVLNGVCLNDGGGSLSYSDVNDDSPTLINDNKISSKYSAIDDDGDEEQAPQRGNGRRTDDKYMEQYVSQRNSEFQPVRRR